MAITETALVGIACILTNTPGSGGESLYGQLNQTEQMQVTQMVESGLCVPQSIEKILEIMKNGTPEQKQRLIQKATTTPCELTF